MYNMYSFFFFLYLQKQFFSLTLRVLNNEVPKMNNVCNVITLANICVYTNVFFIFYLKKTNALTVILLLGAITVLV